MGVIDPVIRTATPEDAPAIAQVHVASWRWAYRGQLPDGLLDSLSVDRRLAAWRDALAGGRETTFVAEVAGRVVGFASCGSGVERDIPPDTGELSSMYLLEEAAGRGIGAALMSRVLQDLRDRGFARAVLWVLATNDRARRFYEAMGWKHDGATKSDTHPFEEVELREVRYAIDLRGATA